jgi:thymidylate kinase
MFVYKIFKQLTLNKIQWCHWKSNEHLLAGVHGDTDLDVLIDGTDQKDLKAIVSNHKGIYFSTSKFKAYNDVYDAIFYNPDDGKLRHLHIHHALPIGERFLKSYSFLPHKRVLENKVSNDQGVFMSDPSDEMVLLFIRDALKIRLRDILYRKNWGNKIEYDWLKERVSLSNFKKSVEGFKFSFGSEPLIVLYDDYTFDNHKKLKQDILETERHPALTQVKNTLQMWTRELVWILSRLQGKFSFNTPYIMRRRVLPKKSIYVAFVGPDGSGKSTVIKTMKKEWSKKMDIRSVYFGNGDGHKNIMQSALLLLKSFKPKTSNLTQKKTSGSGQEKGYASVLWALSCAIQKYRQSRLAAKLRRKNCVVLADRYPQIQQDNINDGLLLNDSKNSTNIIKRYATRIERFLFEITINIKPDIIIRLLPSVEIARQRKPDDMPLERLIEKHKLIQEIRFDSGIDIYEIDADQSLDKVLSQVKGIVWNKMFELNT